MKKSFKNCIPIIALIFMLNSCKEKVPEENPINKVLKIKELSDLATVEYTVTKIIKATDDSTWYKLGDRKILMSCDAKIKAGVSLSEITDKDIVVNGTSVSIQLPAAKILYINIPPESVVERYAEIGLLRAEYSIAEKNAFLQVAEKDVTNTLKELDILATAEKNTKTIIESWLSIAGFKNIAISFKK